ncbi:MAG: hypothetical protein R2873_34550 [Caldilineaceae bacterium]
MRINQGRTVRFTYDDANQVTSLVDPLIRPRATPTPINKNWLPSLADGQAIGSSTMTVAT